MPENGLTEKLTQEEAEQLATWERDIEDGINGYEKAGRALAGVRETKLYIKAGYKSFDAYCKEKWGMRRRNADYLIEASVVSKRLATAMESKTEQHVAQFVDSEPVAMPSNARQDAALAKAPEDEQADIWEEVVQTTAKPTAAVIKAVVEKRAEAKAEPKPAKKEKAPLGTWENTFPASAPTKNNYAQHAGSESKPMKGAVEQQR